MIIPGNDPSFAVLLNTGHLPQQPLTESLTVSLRGAMFTVDPGTQTVFPQEAQRLSYVDQQNRRDLKAYIFERPAQPQPVLYPLSPENFASARAVWTALERYPIHFGNRPRFIVQVQSINYLVTSPHSGNPAGIQPVWYNPFNGTADIVPVEQRTRAMTITAKAFRYAFSVRPSVCYLWKHNKNNNSLIYSVDSGCN